MFKKIHRAALIGAALLTATLQSPAALSAEQAAEEATLYDRLGGYPAIVAVVEDLFRRLAGDPQLARFWKYRGDDGIAREKQLLIDYLANRSGGPLYYRGRENRLSHIGMGITESDWTITMKHIKATLTKFEVPQRERGEVIAFIESTKREIVDEMIPR